MLWTGQIERNSGAVSGCEIDRGGANEEIVSDERSWCKIIPVRVCVCVHVNFHTWLLFLCIIEETESTPPV